MMIETKGMRSIPDLQKIFNEELKSQRFSGSPKELYEPFDYILGLGGKRMRPVLLLHACELFGGDAFAALPQAVAIELFHNFTLIHDDIMDRAPLRRGLPSVHEKFNSTIAILSGDAMLVVAYKYLVQADSTLLPVLLKLFNDCAVKVCEGQQMDMNFETTWQLSVADYLRMIELKTATLMATSLKMGAILGGAPDNDAEHLYNFGKHLGISFQLKDDWLDSFGNAEKVGKQPGGDIIQNKKTFLIIEAMNNADEATKQKFNVWYSREDFNPEEKVDAVLQLFNRLGINDRTKKEMQKHFDVARYHLDQLSVGETSKAGLRRWSESLLHRDS